MKKSTLVHATATLALCAATTASASANAYCTVGDANITDLPQYTFDAADLPAPVYLVTDDGTLFDHSAAQVGRAVGRAVDAINRYGMSTFTLRYAGVMTNAQKAAHNGVAIFIQAESDCTVNSYGAWTAKPDVDASNHVIKADIFLKYNQALCPTYDWEFYPNYATCVPGNCDNDMQGTITHELLHAAGLLHSGSGGNCGDADDGSQGIMTHDGGPGHTERRSISRDDIEGLVSLYGRRHDTIDYHYSYNGGLSWSNGGLLGSTISLSALSSVSTATEGETQLFFGYHTHLGSWNPYRLSMTTSGTNATRQIGGLNVFHPQPVAYGNGTLVAARFTHETRTNNSKRMRWAWSTDDGDSWLATDGMVDAFNRIQTRRNGLAVAYDPKTVQFIAAYVGDDNAFDNEDFKCDDTLHGIMCDELRVVTFDPVTGDQQHTNLGVRTASAPSIACGDTTAWRNCVISWVSTTANACVHWGHGRILNDGSFELYNDLATNCMHGYSAPVVTYDDTEPSNPWRMALTQETVGNHNRIYTFRKGSSYGAAWTDQRSFTVTNDFRVLGDIGMLRSAGGSEKAQVMYVRD